MFPMDSSVMLFIVAMKESAEEFSDIVVSIGIVLG